MTPYAFVPFSFCSLVGMYFAPFGSGLFSRPDNLNL